VSWNRRKVRVDAEIRRRCGGAYHSSRGRACRPRVIGLFDHASPRIAMPIFVKRYLRAHKVAQAWRQLRSPAWLDEGCVVDRGGCRCSYSRCLTGSASARRYQAWRRPAPRLAPSSSHAAVECGVHPRSSAGRGTTARFRSWTPTATSCRACRRWRPAIGAVPGGVWRQIGAPSASGLQAAAFPLLDCPRPS
jgi:hypothetical protein